MRVFNQGKTLSPGDLGLNVREQNGALVDPFSIAYTIFQLDANDVATLASAPKLRPMRCSQGTYYAGGLVPTMWLGKFQVTWYLQQYQISEETMVHEEFEVVRIDPATSSFEAPSVLLTHQPGMSPAMVEMIMDVRELLSDENPDRNYHFRPPTEGKIVAGFNDRVGFIWTDKTIIRMLHMAAAQANTYNPMALYSYTPVSAPKDWRKALAVGAAAKCLSKEAARFLADQFEYSLNGVSLSINKSAEYQSLANDYANEFTTWLPLLTANRPACSGLRQGRYLLG